MSSSDRRTRSSIGPKQQTSGSLVALELENWKSYAGKHILGPLSRFTCIIGPNGAGKSNIIDAIRFVLGCHARDLRCTSLTDLSHNSAPGSTSSSSLSKSVTEAGAAEGSDDQDVDETLDSEQSRDVSCSVSLVFRSTNAAGASIEIRFTRSVLPNGSGRYAINGKTASFQDYCTGLLAHGLSPLAKTGFVLQHEVRRLSLKTSKELTELFEQVSGSAVLKGDYERLRAELDASSAEYVAAHKRKKSAQTEKAQAEMQKTAAQEYVTVSNQIEHAKREQALTRLFALEMQVRNARADVAAAAETLKKAEIEDREVREKVQDLKKRRVKINKELSAAEKKAKDSNLSSIDESITKLNSEKKDLLDITIPKAAKALDSWKDKKASHSSETLSLQADLKKASELLDRHVKAEEKAQLAAAEAAASAEKEIEGKASVQSSLERALLPVVRQEHQLDRDAEQDRNAMKNLQERTASLKMQISDSRERVEVSRVRLQNLESQHAQITRSIAAIDAAMENDRERKIQLEASTTNKKKQLEDLDAARRELKDTQRESTHAQQMRVAVQHMVQSIRGVRGRTCDLVRVLQPSSNTGSSSSSSSSSKNENAYVRVVASAMGRYWEAILVDDVKAARECMAYLRDQRIGSAVFLPLDSIQAHIKAPEERFRHLGGTARRAVDLVEPRVPELSLRSAIEKAIQFACGNTVAVDTLDEARELAYGSQRLGVKICALDGSVIHKNGILSGGGSPKSTSPQYATYMQQSDEDPMSVIKSRMELLVAQVKDEEREYADLVHANTAARLEERRSFELNARQIKQELTVVTKRLEEQQKEIQTLSSLTSELESEADRVMNVLATYESRKKDLQAQRGAIEQETLSRLGVNQSSISALRAAEEKKASAAKVLREAQEHRAQTENTVGKLKASLSYLERSLEEDDSRIKKLTAQIQTDKDRISEIERELQRALSRAEERRSTEAKRRELITQLERELVAIDQEIRSTAAEDRQRSRDVQDCKGRLTEISERVDISVRDRTALLERMRLDGITNIPKRSVNDDSDNDDEEGESELGEWLSEILVDELSSDKYRIDFSSLPKAARDVASKQIVSAPASKRRKVGRQTKEKASSEEGSAESSGRTVIDDGLRTIISEYEEKIRGMTAQRDRMAQQATIPSLSRANETLAAADTRLKHAKRDCDKSREVQQQAEHHFKEVQTKRTDLFMRLFNSVSVLLPEIYRGLTADSENPLGGSAFLGLEAPEEPFSSGVKFNCTPPGKRVIAEGLNSRSGGEQTVSALALVIALQVYSGAPFLVMDEMDAALDPVNISKITRLLRVFSHSQSWYKPEDNPTAPPVPDGVDIRIPENGTQVLVISHREIFFENADALMGICRDEVVDGSRILSLDLTQFDE
eukprot:ANDGO_02603.mRNA.1 Structural maintenance of chromosomes protein 1